MTTLKTKIKTHQPTPTPAWVEQLYYRHADKRTKFFLVEEKEESHMWGVFMPYLMRTVVGVPTSLLPHFENWCNPVARVVIHEAVHTITFDEKKHHGKKFLDTVVERYEQEGLMDWLSTDSGFSLLCYKVEAQAVLRHLIKTGRRPKGSKVVTVRNPVSEGSNLVYLTHTIQGPVS